jgi:pyruvate dehydrogenase E2 component (dihydrolipoamide acetyltransferase)
MGREFRLPDLGEGIAEGQIVRILCAEGDHIAEDQAIMEVETDKAAVEIPSPFGGVASKIHVKEGETVAVGQVLLTVEETNGAGTAHAETAEPAKTEKPREKAPAESAKTVPAPKEAGVERPAESPATPAPKRSRAAAAPAVRKLARETGVDIDSLHGTGPGGRVLRGDVEAAALRTPPRAAEENAGAGAAPVAHAPAPLPGKAVVIEGVPGNDKWGPIKRQKLSQIRKTIAKQMVKSVSTIPHVTQTDEADVTALESIRRDLRGEDGAGPRVTLMAFVLKALAHCLREHPTFNASFDEEHEEIIYKEYINIGVAVDSPRGLVVPVIRDVDRLSVLGIAEALTTMSGKVRDVQFTVDELRGGTFTVTNYGAIGGIYGTPVINHPEVAILGLGRTAQQLRLVGEEIEPRQILPLSLSFDHRATDGAQAARFINDIVAHLSKPGLLLIK